MDFVADAWPEATLAIVDGQPCRMFSGCNYLGLSHHPSVLEALQTALRQFGLAANGSPITTGKARPHGQLEQQLAEFLGQDSALLAPDGALANIAACQGLAVTHQVALLDERSHSSLLSAARAAGLRCEFFGHLDAAHALQRYTEFSAVGCVLMTDGVFATSGQRAPLSQLLRELPAQATLLIDDCHGFGVLGPGGQGSLAEARLHLGSSAVGSVRCLVTSSLSKGLGCSGGVIAGSHEQISQIRNTAGAYRTTTPFPAALAVAAQAALLELKLNPTLLSALRRNVEQLRQGFSRLGLGLAGEHVPIFCVVPPNREYRQRLQSALSERGLGVPLMDYPGGPAGEYFRIAVCAAHTEWDIRQLLLALEDAGSGAP
jgi:8-amino-7-oxononanoate synthase